jgi:hypothetical protein
MAYTLKLGLCNKLCNAVLSGKPTFIQHLFMGEYLTSNILDIYEMRLILDLTITHHIDILMPIQ